jgi:hypothetical protein
MVEKFAQQFQQHGFDAFVDQYQENPPGSYDAIFEDVVRFLADENDFDAPDPDRVTVIDHGDWQGTRVWVVAEQGYQPSRYYVCKVGYGSCSGCDTFEAIRGWGDPEDVTEEQAKDYATLALHMVQGMKEC